MRKSTQWLLTLTVLMILFCIMPSIIFAQGDPGADPDITVPVDGGLSILAAAGVAYSVKKIREYRKKNETSLKR